MKNQFEDLYQLENKASECKKREEILKQEMYREFQPQALTIIKESLCQIFTKFPSLTGIRWDGYVCRYNDEYYEYESDNLYITFEEKINRENWEGWVQPDDIEDEKLQKSIFQLEKTIVDLNDSFGQLFGKNNCFVATPQNIEIYEAYHTDEPKEFRYV